eukprot:4455912-Prymnesium_polylepis.1
MHSPAKGSGTCCRGFSTAEVVQSQNDTRDMYMYMLCVSKYRTASRHRRGRVGALRGRHTDGDYLPLVCLTFP